MANEIYGNLKGIRNSVIDELKTFYDIRIEGGSLLNTELAMRMADVTDFINREVSVYLSRSGQVLAVAVGNDQSVENSRYEVGEKDALCLSRSQRAVAFHLILLVIINTGNHAKGQHALAKVGRGNANRYHRIQH